MQDNIYSNFITPPDFVDEPKHTVLLIDVVDDQVQSIGMFCKHTTAEFNVYLYNADMDNMTWFSQAVDHADIIIVNTIPNKFSPLKDIIAESPKACYYGPKTQFKNPRRINNPIDYFIEYADTSK
jgi:hypothetical protein